MKIILWIGCLCFMLNRSTYTYAQAMEPKIFSPKSCVDSEGLPIWMVSLSELLPVSEETGEPMAPLFDQLTSNDSATLESVKYIELDEKGRQQLLKMAGLSESNDLYVFDVRVNRAFAVPVELLKVIAYLDEYTTELPVTESDYFIGFLLDEDVMAHYSTSWVWLAFGDKDPFGKRLKNIRWKACNPSEFPKGSVPEELHQIYNDQTLQPDSCFRYASHNQCFYLRNYIADGQVVAKHLIIADKKSGRKIYDRVYELCENCAFTPLTEQYTGKLLKNFPEVIFGFVYPAYSCPAISVIDKAHTEVPVICDNRN